MQTVARRPRIVGARSPVGRVVPARPIYGHAVVGIGPAVSRSVADVHDLRRRVVDVHVGEVVGDRLGRNVYELVLRNVVGERPRAGRCVGDEPDRVVAGVVLPVHPQHLGGGVDGVGDVRPLDPLEPGGAVVGHLELRLAALDRRRLRHVHVEHRVFGLRRSRHRSARAAEIGGGRNLPERGRQRIGGDEAPRSSHRARAEPAARQQEVDVVRRDLPHDRGLGVLHVQQVPHADRPPLGRTVRHHELGWLGRDDDLRWRLRRRDRGGVRGNDAGDVGRRRFDRTPWPHRIAGGVPDLAAAQVVLGPVPHDREGRVRHLLEVRAGNRQGARRAIVLKQLGQLLGE